MEFYQSDGGPVVAAMQFDGMNAGAVMRWSGSGGDGLVRADTATVEGYSFPILRVTYADGESRIAIPGDRILKTKFGRLIPCQQWCFLTAYKPVETADAP